MRPNSALALLAAAVLAAACTETAAPPRPGVPAQLDVVEGDAQVDTVGQELPVALAVRVVDSEGRPVAGQTVNFRVVAGGGSVFAGAATTNANGLARERWTLGTAAGDTQRVEVRAVHPETGDRQVFAVFTAVGVADSPAQIEAVGPTSRTGAAGQPLADSLGVRLRDRYGNPVPGVQVSWATQDGSVSPALASTGSDGISRSQWVLGTQTGSAQQATASAGPLSVQFSAVAAIPADAILRRISGDNQVGTVGQPLADSLVVRMQLADGRPLAGVQITWGADPNGFATPAVSVTDATGRAKTRWTLGTGSGTQTLYAFAPGGRNTRFLATANPGAPVRIVKYLGDAQSALPGTRLPIDPAVRLLDEFGNGVRNRFVAWTVTGGGGSVSPTGSTTGEGGIARTGWTLGGPGPQTLRASSGSLTPVTFSASAVPANAVAPQTMTVRTGEVDTARVSYQDNATTQATWVSLDSAIAYVARTPTAPYRTAAILGKKPGTTGIVVTVGAFRDTVQVTVLPMENAFTQVTMGLGGACATNTVGAVYCWGVIPGGSPLMPGEDGVRRLEAPGRLTGALGVQWIMLSEPPLAGEEMVCAGVPARAAFCWGQLPAITLRNTSTPGELPGGRYWDKVEAGRLHACGIWYNDTLYCWGRGKYGALGNGSTTSRNTYTPVSGGLTWSDITAGTDFTCGLTTSGAAYCWGFGLNGELGTTAETPQMCYDEDFNEGPCSYVPIPVDGGHTFTMIDAGPIRVCALDTAGTVWCWGHGYGNVPVAVSGVQFTDVDVHYRECGVSTTGLAYCWTSSQRNALPPPVSTTIAFRHVENANQSYCGISTANVVYCWGLNNYGQLGTGDRTDRAAPTRVVGQP